jgi:hypothetical protein
MDYKETLVKINAMIKNAALTFGMHPDEVFVDLSEMD